MKQYQQHTFYFVSEEDYLRQLDMEMQKILGKRMEAYAVVRARYPEHSVTGFSMRLKRFMDRGGKFPHLTGGRRITELAVTPALDAWLRQPIRPRQ